MTTRTSRALVVRFTLLDTTAAERFDTLLAQALPGVREEPGTLLYCTHEVADEPLVRVVYAAYRDEVAHAVHDAGPVMSVLLAELARLTSDVSVDELVLTSGTPIPFSPTPFPPTVSPPTVAAARPTGHV